MKAIAGFLLASLFFAAPAAAQTCSTADNSGVMVIGGTGFLGSYHVKQLSAAGERVIIFARSSSTYERVEGAEYEVVLGDLTEPATITAAIAEAKPAVIIDASNYPGVRFEDGQTFYWPSMQAIVRAAEANCVSQIIRHSARGARAALTNPMADPKITNYMRDVARAELALEQSSVASTIVYNRNLPPEPAEPTGRGALLDDLSADGGITRSDLARITNTCVLNPACYGQIFNGIDAELDAN